MNTVSTLGRALAGSTLVAATLFGGLSTPATAAAPAEPAMSCAEVWESLPAQMRADITAARSLPPRPQHRAMKAIRYAALAGVYGEDVERMAEARKEHREELWAVAPAQFKADVRAALSLPFHEQRRALRVIRAAALRGVYGDGVQAVAEARRDWLGTCPRSGNAI